MKLGWIILAPIVVLASSALPASAARLALIPDKDTVAGIEAPSWTTRQTWLPPNTVRIRNPTAQGISLDSIRVPSDSVGPRGDAEPLRLVFAVRNPAGEIREYPMGIWRSAPIAIPAGDSVELGMFEIGRAYYPVKVAATARRYQPGDSIIAPLTFFAGPDSMRLILKAKVQTFAIGSGGIVIRADAGRWSPSQGKAATADGRSVAEADPGMRILFGGQSSRPAPAPR